MTGKSVLLLDAGLGNIGSVLSALRRHDCSINHLSTPPSLESTREISHLILPGVGSFASGMHKLQANGWVNWLQEVWVPSGKPLLGICLGMQLLATKGSEGCEDTSFINGLNIIPGTVTQLPRGSNLFLPHVGWNGINWKADNHPLMKGLPHDGDMYFVHSFAFQTDDVRHSLACTDYGSPFTSIVSRGLFFGAQFHPEKSQKLGYTFLSNFLNIFSC